MQGTDTFGTEGPRDRDASGEWTLAIALDCARLGAPPLRLSLAGVTEVEIGRGALRAMTRAGTRLRMDLPDRWASQHHARLTRTENGWIAADAGSKNGTRVNGRPLLRDDEPTALADGDVIECGGTFLVIRSGGREGDVVDPKAPLPTLLTLAPALEREFAILPRIARSRVPVIVRGESGTGKEVVASAIHALSGRSGPLIAVNCGAIPASLIESELFGSRRGAFSGAEDRHGLIRNAEHGTLFLDEVAELPAPSQAALLRVLQDGEVLPLGAGKPITVDVRIVAATNRPLEELAEDGRFRRDLYARLRGYEVQLPPLKARMEDLGLLISALLDRLEPERRTDSASSRKLSLAAARALFLHRWPFHVRELEQTLRAAIAVATGPEIGHDDLPATLRSTTATPAPSGAAAARSGVERTQLVALLAKHRGNLSAVARELSTSRSQVHRLLARHALTADGGER